MTAPTVSSASCSWYSRWWHRLWRVIDQIAVDRFWLSAAEVLQDYRDLLPVQPTTLCNEIEAKWKAQPCRSSHWNCACARLPVGRGTRGRK